MKAAGLILVALLIAIGLSFGGALAWSWLFRINTRVCPALPWSAALSFVGMAVCWAGLRRAPGFPAALPDADQRPRAFLSVLPALAAADAAVIVGLRLGHFDGGAFASDLEMNALPVSLQIARVITTAAVAAFFEEAGFRGFFMRALQARCGPRSAIAISTLVFYALHLGHDWARGDLVSMLAIAVPFFIAGALFGTLAWLSGSLLPSMLLHFLIDATLLPLEWYGLHQLTPVATSGLDVHLFTWALVCIAGTGATVWALARLRAGTIGDPSPPPRA
jgi:membrane protease YdiL (CAAX protease family)